MKGFALLFCLLSQALLSSVAFGGQKHQAQPAFRVLILTNPGWSYVHQVDRRNIQKSFENISHNLKIPLHLKAVDSRAFSIRKLQKWSNKIHPDSDIVFVYYSGHQSAPEDNQSTWPSILLSSRPLPIDAIAEIIHGKKARLSVVAADCYESVIKRKVFQKFYYGEPVKRTSNHRKLKGFKEAWLQSKGSLTLCSHAAGEKGCGVILKGGLYEGGVFTEVLLRRLAWGKLSRYPISLQEDMYKCLGLYPQHILCSSTITE